MLFNPWERKNSETSISKIPLQKNYRETENSGFALEMKRDHSVIFEIASKYCISDSFADYESYSVSSMGFLYTVVDMVVI